MRSHGVLRPWYGKVPKCDVRDGMSIRAQEPRLRLEEFLAFVVLRATGIARNEENSMYD